MERRDEPERRAYKVVTVPGMWDKVDCYPRDHEGNEDGKRQDEVDRKDVNGKRLRQEGESRGQTIILIAYFRSC